MNYGKCPDCNAPAIAPNDFCENHVPHCEICGGSIPWRLAGVHYANCGSTRCEYSYYED